MKPVPKEKKSIFIMIPMTLHLGTAFFPSRNIPHLHLSLNLSDLLWRSAVRLYNDVHTHPHSKIDRTAIRYFL